MVKFCPVCKKIYPISTTVCPSCHSTNLMRFCQNCKKMLPAGAISCPVCGDTDTTQITTGRTAPSNVKKKKNRVVFIFLTLFLLVSTGAAAWWFLFSDVEKVEFDPIHITLIEGESATIEYTLFPKWAILKNFKWESSDDKVATVTQEGEVTAVGKGYCTVDLAISGVHHRCNITVERDGIDLKDIYKEIGGEGYYCKLANDESYLEIDTNPNDEEFYLKDDEGAEYVVKANKALGLPDSVTIKMSQTRALDGRQTETYEDITVSWTYHPDHGLDVLYEVK